MQRPFEKEQTIIDIEPEPVVFGKALSPSFPSPGIVPVSAPRRSVNLQVVNVEPDELHITYCREEATARDRTADLCRQWGGLWTGQNPE